MKNVKKSLLTTLSVLAIMSGMLVVVSCGDSKDSSRPSSQGLEYTLINDGQSYAVTGIGECTDTDIVLPSIHEGLPVTSIGNEAFANCISLTSIEISDSITSIGNKGFYNCSKLTSVEIPDSVTSIDGGAFAYTGLTSVVLGDSVTSIKGGAFTGCDKLTSVYYKGTASDWRNIEIHFGNSSITNTMRYYYSETQPTEAGNYWYYDENGEVVVW